MMRNIFRSHLLERTEHHSAKLEADVAELGRWYGQANGRVADGQALLARITSATHAVQHWDDTSALEELWEDLMDYYHFLEQQDFTRSFFDEMALGLDQVRQVGPVTARTYPYIKDVSSIIGALGLRKETASRARAQLHRLFSTGLGVRVERVASQTDPGAAERAFEAEGIFMKVRPERLGLMLLVGLVAPRC